MTVITNIIGLLTRLQCGLTTTGGGGGEGMVCLGANIKLLDYWFLSSVPVNSPRFPSHILIMTLIINSPLLPQAFNIVNSNAGGLAG